MTCQADIIYSANHTCSNFTSYKNTYALQSIPHARSILKWSRWWIAIDDRVSVTKRKWRETCSLPLLFCLGTIGQEINRKFVALNGSCVQKYFCLWVNGYHKENFNTNASCLQANSSMPAHQDKTSWIWPFMKRLNMACFLFFFFYIIKYCKFMFLISCNIGQMFYKSIKEYNNKHWLLWFFSVIWGGCQPINLEKLNIFVNMLIKVPSNIAEC